MDVILYGVLSMLLTATMMRRKLQRILYHKEMETLEVSKRKSQERILKMCIRDSDITDFLGDFSELKESLLYILKRFNSTLTEISNLAEQVSSNSSEVENASKSLEMCIRDSLADGEQLSGAWLCHAGFPCAD